MRVHLAFLAEAANYSDSGNISAVGILIGRVEVDVLPTGMPRLDFVISIIFEGDDLDRTHIIRTQALDPSGEPFHNESRAIVDAPRPAEHEGKGVVQTAIINHNLVAFDQEGEYKFQIEVDGEVVTSVGLRIFLRPAVEARDDTGALSVDDTKGDLDAKPE